MPHRSSPSSNLSTEHMSQSSRFEGSAWAREKRFATVLGRQMAYIERGEGHPIVFCTAIRLPRSYGETFCLMSRHPAGD